MNPRQLVRTFEKTYIKTKNNMLNMQQFIDFWVTRRSGVGVFFLFRIFTHKMSATTVLHHFKSSRHSIIIEDVTMLHSVVHTYTHTHTDL